MQDPGKAGLHGSRSRSYTSCFLWAALSPEKGAKLWKKFQNELQLRTSGPCPSPLSPSGDDIEHEQRLRPRRRPIKGADIQMTSACVCVVGVMIRKKTDPPSTAGSVAV